MGDERSRWPDGCGNGRWCERCREEIREEALLWLQELNVLTPPPPSARVITTAWHRRWQLSGK
jgi:hypothetical protein